eukprot:scaffold12110_cov88-Isochrysis_galbana.AAC.2
MTSIGQIGSRAESEQQGACRVVFPFARVRPSPSMSPPVTAGIRNSVLRTATPHKPPPRAPLRVGAPLPIQMPATHPSNSHTRAQAAPGRGSLCRLRVRGVRCPARPR